MCSALVKKVPALAFIAGLIALFLCHLVTQPSSLAQDKQDKKEAPAKAAPEALPFTHKVEVFRSQEGDVTVFCLRLEQAFLAEEFEKSNYLRLQALDQNAYLIYPKETKFHQKHAEFYGRLRGQGKARLRLAYEIVSENLDGTRKVDVRQGDIEVAIPEKPGGPATIYTDWARQQNEHFANLLTYYPHETFLQYALLQSRDRYGVMPPRVSLPAGKAPELEESLYHVFTGSLALQEALQRYTLDNGAATGDLKVPIHQLTPPALQSPPYKELLEKKRQKNIQPKVHEVARLVPADQYMLHFNSMTGAGDLLDLTTSWGDSLLRFVTVQARDNRIQQKLEDQLCLRRDPLTRLFADAVISEMAITGSDPFVVEGTDVTIIFKVKQPEVLQKSADGWLAQVKQKYPEVAEREFNYRGHKIAARYTGDRVVSSFVVRHGDYMIFSNSHSAVRKVIDALSGMVPRLQDALDYQYLTTLLPPSDDPKAGYLFISEAFLRRLTGPEAKISEKRRLLCFNNLVMLNNASMFYRLENGKSPASLNDLVEGKFYDPAKLVCPHGGAYAFDARNDTCTCSLHNRLKYLTPNAELPTLKVSERERQEYERYKRRYEEFWGRVFDPIAMRIKMDPRVTLEVGVLPFANGSYYTDLRTWFADKPQPLSTAQFASSAVASLTGVVGRKEIASFLRGLPGIPEVLDADPTLADLGWLGDRVSLHFCDDKTILEIDPARLRPIELAGFKAPIKDQTMVAAALLASNLPVYLTLDVEDRDKAARLLEQLSRKLFLKKGDWFSLPTNLDSYRLPDYKNHAVYVLSYQIYAIKIRLHVALVGNQLVAATKLKTLHEVIDADGNKADRKPLEGHMLLRLNRKAVNQLQGDLQLYWEEKARLACHRNILSIANLVQIYGVPIDEVNRLSEAKYGVTYYCPDEGTYGWDTRRSQVTCSVHGNREHSSQNPGLNRQTSFSRFIDSLDEVTAVLRFEEDGLIATVEIVRKEGGKK